MKLTPSIIPDSGLQSVVESFHKAPGDNPVQQVLRAALERFGPNGENWLSGSGASYDDCQCSIMATGNVIDGRYLSGSDSPAAKHLHAAATELGFTSKAYPRTFCASPATIMNEVTKDFRVIRSAFLRAITLAGQQVWV